MDARYTFHFAQLQLPHHDARYQSLGQGLAVQNLAGSDAISCSVLKLRCCLPPDVPQHSEPTEEQQCDCLRSGSACTEPSEPVSQSRTVLRTSLSGCFEALHLGILAPGPLGMWCKG